MVLVVGSNNRVNELTLGSLMDSFVENFVGMLPGCLETIPSCATAVALTVFPERILPVDCRPNALLLHCWQLP